MCGDADGWITELEDRWRKARKPHVCCACREPIRIGERYHKLVGIWEGELEKFDHCARCWFIYLELRDGTDAEAIDLRLNCGEVWENPPEEVAALAFLTPAEAQLRIE